MSVKLILILLPDKAETGIAMSSDISHLPLIIAARQLVARSVNMDLPSVNRPACGLVARRSLTLTLAACISSVRRGRASAVLAAVHGAAGSARSPGQDSCAEQHSGWQAGAADLVRIRVCTSAECMVGIQRPCLSTVFCHVRHEISGATGLIGF